jgi:CheY-like chemotaxis protein
MCGEDAVRTEPILVIDDDQVVRALVTSVLTGASYKVLEALGGQEGIEIARKTQPTIILLRIKMGGVHGIGTCERLKRDAVLHDIPVVGVTDSQDLADTEQAFRAGAEFFLARPFEPEALLQVVGMALERAERRSPSQRLHPRFRARVPVRCAVGTDAEVVGTTGNLSLGGLLLMLPKKLTTGAVFRLGLELPKGLVPAEGAVMWERSKPLDDGSFLHGIRFLRFVEDAGPMQYRCFLSEIAATSPA